MKIQLKVASVAVAVAAVVINTFAVSLATVDDPPQVYFAHSALALPSESGAAGLGTESRISEIMRLTGNSARIPEAYMNQANTAAIQTVESRISEILRMTGSSTRIPEAFMGQDGATVATRFSPSIAEELTAIARVIGNVSRGEQVLLGVGSPNHMIDDLGEAPWVAKAVDLARATDPQANLSGGEQVAYDIG